MPLSLKRASIFCDGLDHPECVAVHPDGTVWAGGEAGQIYRISASEGVVQTKLTINPAIDSSPSYSPDGSQIAFVSNRQGNPQIFVMPSTGGAGNAKRVTFQGKYNQTPRWNPRADKPQIAFTGRDEKGVFDIFILDVRSGKIERVTQAKGSNQDPAWSPD